MGWATVEITREEQVVLAVKSVLFSCGPTAIVEDVATRENIFPKFVCLIELVLPKEIKIAMIEIRIATPAIILFIFLIKYFVNVNRLNPIMYCFLK